MKLLLKDFIERDGVTYAESDLHHVIDALPMLTPKGPWMAGGALRRTISRKPLDSDFDIFFPNEAALTSFAAGLKQRGLEKVKETQHHEHWRGTLAGAERDVQLVRFRYYASSDEVIDSFDFTICQLATDGERLTLGDMTLWDVARKRLVLHRLTYPVSTMRRLLKYQKQGYYACSGCLARILKDTVDSAELHTQLDIDYVD